MMIIMILIMIIIIRNNDATHFLGRNAIRCDVQQKQTGFGGTAKARSHLHRHGLSIISPYSLK